MLAADYPFLDIFWTMILFFVFVAWIWLLISVVSDVFRRRDLSGVMKALWVVGIVVAPFLGVLLYLIVNGDGMAERNLREAKSAQGQVEDYIRSVAGGPATEIEKAKGLLDSGAITQSEYDAIKQRALAQA